MEKLFEKFGVEIYKNKGEYYLRLDTGEITVQVRNILLSEHEARSIIAIDNPDDLYNYMIRNLNDRI